MLAAPRARQQEVQLDPEALRIIREITGETEPTLRNFLATAKVLGQANSEYRKILTYVENGQEHQHLFSLSVDKVIRLHRWNDPNFPPQNGVDHEFRMLLWHGTLECCVGGIIRNGLEVPDDLQQMLGPAIYFSDRASKSAQYCCKKTPGAGRPPQPPRGSKGYLFLCDVKVGKMKLAKGAHPEYTSAPPDCDSVKCSGYRIPDWKFNEDVDGAAMPVGPTIKNKRFVWCKTQFNEYAIYDPNQISLKYLVVVDII